MDKIKIMIVEDQPITALDIKNTIISLGYDVTNIASSFDDAIKKFELDIPDIVIMDIALKGEKTGIDTVKELYRIKQLPIVYLTAFIDDYTMEEAIKTKPAAYEIKPFDRMSLKSSIMIAISKMSDTTYNNTNPKKTALGHNYYYLRTEQKLFYKDEEIKITQQESKLLELLIDSNNQMVPYHVIQYEIWGDNMVSESSIRTLVWRLRTKLENKIIVTVPNLGIKIESEVKSEA